MKLNLPLVLNVLILLGVVGLFVYISQVGRKSGDSKMGYDDCLPSGYSVLYCPNGVCQPSRGQCCSGTPKWNQTNESYVCP